MLKSIHTTAFALLLLATAGLQAQNLTFTHSPVVVSNVDATDAEGVGEAEVTNTADVTRSLKWTRIVQEMTTGWDVAVCDLNLCYPPHITTRNFTLGANQSGTMDVHVYPNGIEGAAIIEVLVQDNADTTLQASNLYYFNAQPSRTTNVQRQSVKVYPNPSGGLFSIKGSEGQVGSLEVFSLTGQRVKAFTYNDGQWYNISDLPRGTYLVRLIDRSGKQMVTKILNKF